MAVFSSCMTDDLDQSQRSPLLHYPEQIFYTTAYQGRAVIAGSVLYYGFDVYLSMGSLIVDHELIPRRCVTKQRLQVVPLPLRQILLNLVALVNQ